MILESILNTAWSNSVVLWYGCKVARKQMKELATVGITYSFSFVKVTLIKGELKGEIKFVENNKINFLNFVIFS